MPQKTTIRAIGNSAGTTISKSLLERFQLHERVTVYVVETEEDILITPFDPDFSEAMQIYQEKGHAPFVTPCMSWPDECGSDGTSLA